jgi:hypothetical protein
MSFCCFNRAQKRSGASAEVATGGFAGAARKPIGQHAPSPPQQEATTSVRKTATDHDHARDATRSGHPAHLGEVVKLTKAEIEECHHQLYRTRVLPSTWVFNDFGHVTCFLYKDLNRNRHRDPNEPIHGEFLHTTPV